MLYNIVELKEELERQQKSKYDVIKPAEKVVFFSGENGVYIPVENLYGQTEYMKLNGWATQQVATKLGVPISYVKKMAQAYKWELIAKNFNGWIQDLKDKKVMIRTLDGQIRAFLSSRYYYIENIGVFWTTLGKLKEYNAQIHEMVLTEQRMYIKAILPHAILEVREHDLVYAGVIIRNSEVGAGRLAISPFFLRKICENGMIGEHGYNRIHIGSDRDEGVINWSERTRQLDSELIKSKINDAIDTAFNPDIMMEWLEAVKNGTEFEIESIKVGVEAVNLKIGLGKQEKEDLLEYFAREEKTQWGLANSITRMAKNSDNYERKIELEYGGNIIATMSQEDMERLIEKARKEVKE